MSADGTYLDAHNVRGSEREREAGEVVSALGLALLMGRHAVAHICELERSPVRTCSVRFHTQLCSAIEGSAQGVLAQL